MGAVTCLWPNGLLLIAIVVGIFTPSVARAYIDPGTGSMVLQALLAAVLAAGVVLKTFWHRIKTKLGWREISSPEDDDRE